MRNERGFTAMELIFGVCGMVWAAVIIYIVYLVIAALSKYVNG